MGELYDVFVDMWPLWRSVLEPVITPEVETALDALNAHLADFFAVPYLDEIATLDGSRWAEVRRCARTILSTLS